MLHIVEEDFPHHDFGVHSSQESDRVTTRDLCLVLAVLITLAS